MANVEALRQVIRVLEKVADDGRPFDLKNWTGSVYEEREIRERGWFGSEKVRFEKHECGTAGCAIGWSASDPWFIVRGLHLGKYGGEQQVPIYGELENWNAVAAFFELTRDETKTLFDMPSYVGRPTPLDVAARISAWIEAKERNDAERRGLKDSKTSRTIDLRFR